jgi:hypothetical protein
MAIIKNSERKVNSLPTGIDPNDIVRLDGTGKLPAVDGSQLTGISGGGGASALDALTDVDVSTITPINKQILSYDGTDWNNAVLFGTAANNLVQLDPAGKLPAIDGSQLTNLPAPGASALDALTDVDVSTITPAAGQVLTHDGTDWDNTLSVGTAANNIVQLDGTGKLPAVDGSQLTGIAVASSFIGCRIHQTAAQSIPTGTGVYTYVTFETEDYDTSGFHDNATNNDRITIPTSGYYQVSAAARFTINNGTGIRGGAYEVDGTTYYAATVFAAPASSGATIILPTTTLYLTAGQYIKFGILHDAGVSMDTSPANTQFEVTLLQGAGTGGAATLNELTDVDLVTSAPVSTDVLTFDGTNWVPAAAAAGASATNDLTDVANTTPADKHVLVYDGVTDNRYENRLLTEADISDLQSYALASHNHVLADITDSGTAAALNVGTTANNIVQLDGTGKLPAVDGSLLTGIATETGTHTHLVSDVLASGGVPTYDDTDTDLICYYKLEDAAGVASESVTDSGPAANHGTLLSTGTLVTGADGSVALDMSGAGSIDVPVTLTRTPTTIIGDFYFTTVSGRQFLWSDVDASSNIQTGFMTIENTDGSLRYSVGNGSPFDQQTHATGLTSNTWYRIAQVVDATDVSVYVDGALVATNAHGLTLAGSSTSALRFGVLGQFNSLRFSGYLDNLAVWDRALTASEISKLSASPVTLTETTNDLTDVDTTTITPAANQVLSHNGTDWDNAISIGTAANNIVQLDGSGLLPAVDGSALTNLTLPAGVGSSPGFKGAKVTVSAGQTITTATNTAVSFDVTTYDTNTYWSAGQPTRLTVSETGYYLLQGFVGFAAFNGNRAITGKIYVNGAAATPEITDGDRLSENTGVAWGNPQGMQLLNAGDYIELMAYQDSGGNLNTSTACSLSLTKIETAASGGGFSGARLYSTGGQSFTPASTTSYENIPFNATDYDTDSFITGNSFTVPAPGYYVLAGSMFLQEGNINSMYTRILVNGVIVAMNRDQEDGTRTDHQQSLSTGAIYISPGEDIKLQGRFGTTSTVSVLSGTSFAIFRVDIGASGALTDLTDVDLTTTAPVTDDVLKYDGTNWVPGVGGGGGGGASSYTEVATASTLTGNSKSLADTTSAAVAYTLPVGVVGEFVEVQDAAGNATTNNITMTPQSGEKVENVVDDTAIIDTNGGGIKLIYTTLRGWVVGKA